MKKILFSFSLILSNTFVFAQNKLDSISLDEPRELTPAVQIYFDINKSEIKSKESAKIDELFTRLKKIPEFRLVLTGHTDSTGNDEYNMELSRDRVDEVYNVLLSRQIPEKWMIMKYYGRSKPRVDETDEEKAARNRRVEISVIEKPKPKVVKPNELDCSKDTTLDVGLGMEMTISVCDYKLLNDLSKLNGGNADFTIKVNKISDPLELIMSDYPKVYKKDQGMLWLGALDIQFSNDTCLERPVTITIDPKDFESYRRARIRVLVENLKNKKADRTKDPSKTLGKRTIKRDAVKFILSTACPTSKDEEGAILLASPESKTNVTLIKDQTKKIAEIYAVQEVPTKIIPGIPTKKGFEFRYREIENPYFVIKFKDGTYSEMIPVDDICTLKDKYKTAKTLDKKYKITTKHLGQ